MIEIAPGRMRRSGDCDETQLFDAALELLDGFLWLLHGDKRDALQPFGIGFAVAIEPCVVGVRDGAGEVAIFEKRQTQKYRGAEVDRSVDAFEIHVFDALY